MSILKIKRRLHENPALHINALALVLGRCQKELPKCHVARIEIHRAQSRSSVCFCNFKFNVVCPKLDIDNRFAVHELFVAKECSHRSHADFFFVVVGECERERFQVQVFFAETRLEHSADRFYGFGIFCENANDDFHFGRSSNFTHARKFSKSVQGEKAGLLADPFLSRSHGCRRHQKASDAAKVCKTRKRKNLFLHFRVAATDVVDVKTFMF